jgi:hypothetical protein
MRARRHFQPSFDFMPMRLAPSGVGVVVSPMDPLAGAGSSSSTVVVSPMNPLSGSQGGSSVSDPTAIGPGSYTSTTSTTSPC